MFHPPTPDNRYLVRQRFGFLVLFVLSLLHTFPVFSQTVEDRITAILNQMTTAEKIKQLHAEGGFNTADNTRLGIPGFIMADGPHGVRDGSATSFPVGIGMAATWDVDLAKRVGIAMGKEFRGKGKHQALGPCLDIDRDPRNGRSPETGGEDPYLCAQITTAVVRGIQSTPCIATIKHFNVNHRENGRTTNNIFATQRILHDDAGLAFRTAVQEGGAMSVMNAYNLINGQKCAENANLQTSILRYRWGFPYYVVSDWGAIWNSENAIKAGCEICMGSDNYQKDLPALVANGVVSETVLNQAVRRVLRTKIMAGMLDYIPPGNPNDVNSKAHQELCLESGRKSLVLLKNEGSILPLNRSTIKTIALVGPSAAIAYIDGSGSAYVTPFYTVSPRQGIETKLGAANVFYSKGCDINSADTSKFAEAVALARTADVVVYCGGLDPSQEGEGFDRYGGSTELPGRQQDLINALTAANRNVVVTIISGGICSLSRCIDSIKGLVYAFYPGQEIGNALADVLFGDVNPGGKLPVTMPRNNNQLPPWNDDLTDDYGSGYRWYDKMNSTPQFAFGYGLSYTTFTYSNLTVTPGIAAPGQPIMLSVDVKNSGSRTGEEVVQLYLTHPATVSGSPVKQLKAFKRVLIASGQSTSVSFTLSADELYVFNEATASYEVPSGDYLVRVGGSSSNLPLSVSVQVADSPRKSDLRITNIRAVPPYPLPGQRVVFLASVKNQGSAATVAGSVIRATFTVNGQPASWSDEFSGSIPAGGMALLCGNAGTGGVNTWLASSAGTFSIQATVDPENTIVECVETNNSLATDFTVFNAPLPNLALNKTVAVTSVEKPGVEGHYAVDGNMSTRWSSQYSDPQAMTIDLGGIYRLDDIVLYWESAYAKEYIIKLSDGIGGWTDVHHQKDGQGGMEKISLSVNARKIMMLGIQRATQYGYSLYEIQIHGSIATPVVESDGSTSAPVEFSLDQNYPNPFNPSTIIRYGLQADGYVSLNVYDFLGRRVASLVNEVQKKGEHSIRWNAAGLPSGVYLCTLRQGQHSALTRMILLK